MPFIEPDLTSFEQKVHSQFGEDGVIEQIAACLGLTTGAFFEFGIGPAWTRPIEEGLEGNFVLLAKRGWHGVFLDGTKYPPQYGVRQEFVSPLNINAVYRKHHVPADLDFMSIDVDGQEFWIWLALNQRPKVMVVEYNGGIGPDQSVTIQFDPGHVWDGTCYLGASLRALDRLAQDKGYVLVYANGVNAIFVRDDLVSNRGDFGFDRLYTAWPPHLPDPLNRAWVQV